MPTPVSERIAIVAPSAESAAVLRRDLIAALAAAGHRVLCLTPPGPARYRLILRDLGAQYRAIEPPQAPLRILSGWQTMSALVTHFKDWQPNVVLSYGLETLSLAALAARRSEVPRVVSLVNELPADPAHVSRRRLGEALRASDAIVFHNAGHRRRLEELGLLPAGRTTLVVPGSGIDLGAYPAEPLPPQDPGLVFLMLARLERRRGVLEYGSAAGRLKARWPKAIFRFAGQETDEIAPETLAQSGAVEYLGHLEDVRPALAACHVFVYPSYGEGMPRAVLQALATGRPVITTRTAGCAATVDEMVSGCLVPPADARALEAAMESYLRNPGLLAPGARAARLKAERRFDGRDVNATLTRVLGIG